MVVNDPTLIMTTVVVVVINTVGFVLVGFYTTTVINEYLQRMN